MAPRACGLEPLKSTIHIRTGDGHRCLNTNRLAELNSVVVDEVEEAISAIGDPCYRRPSPLLGVVHQLVGDL